MKKIVIIGAGGFGRELLQRDKDINAGQQKWEIMGFIDDNLHALDHIECDYPVIGRVHDWQPGEDEVFALALGDPGIKELVVKEMKEKGALFADVIHPTAVVTPFSSHGEGLIMFPGSKLSVNSKVGDFVTVLSSGVGHDVLVGDYTTISGMCSVLRNVTIGRRVFVAAGVSIANDLHIGDDSYLGLGSVILKDIPEKSRVFGNPARVMPI